MLPEQQVVQAVPGRGHQHERADGTPDAVDVPVRVEAVGDGTDVCGELLRGRRRLDLEAEEEPAGVVAGELLALGDVAARCDDRTGERVHDAGAVGADEGQDPVGVEGVRHALSLSSASR